MFKVEKSETSRYKNELLSTQLLKDTCETRLKEVECRLSTLLVQIAKDQQEKEKDS